MNLSTAPQQLNKQSSSELLGRAVADTSANVVAIAIEMQAVDLLAITLAPAIFGSQRQTALTILIGIDSGSYTKID